MDRLKVKRGLLESALFNADEIPKDEYYTIYLDEVMTELFKIEKVINKNNWKSLYLLLSYFYLDGII